MPDVCQTSFNIISLGIALERCFLSAWWVQANAVRAAAAALQRDAQQMQGLGAWEGGAEKGGGEPERQNRGREGWGRPAGRMHHTWLPPVDFNITHPELLDPALEASLYMSEEMVRGLGQLMARCLYCFCYGSSPAAYLLLAALAARLAGPYLICILHATSLPMIICIGFLSPHMLSVRTLPMLACTE